MSRYVLWIEYDGGRFAGMQRLTPRAQAPRLSGNPQRWPPQATIQEEVEVKLGLLLGREVSVRAAGRTDAGVHATAQVVAFEHEGELNRARLLHSLNAVLCPAVRVLRWERTSPDFHPRFSARGRTYHYYLWPQAPVGRSPFWSKMCWPLPEALDLEAMRRAVAPLLGTHDFSAYCRQPDPRESRLRELQAVNFLPNYVRTVAEDGPFAQLSDLLCVEVRANAFLRRMVRQLVANLVKVGTGAWPAERLEEILLSRDPLRSAAPAPAQGLFLVRVDYPGFPLA